VYVNMVVPSESFVLPFSPAHTLCEMAADVSWYDNYICEVGTDGFVLITTWPCKKVTLRLTPAVSHAPTGVERTTLSFSTIKNENAPRTVNMTEGVKHA
jgi:hypothetical protein